MSLLGLLARGTISLTALVLASIYPGLGTLAGALLIGIVLGSMLPTTKDAKP